MELIDAIQSRKSIRRFLPDLVSKDILRDILNIASRSPSAMNTQPWEITVVTGHILDKLKAANIQVVSSGIPPHPETPHANFQGDYRQRQVDLAIEIFKLMGISREDKQKRNEWAQRGFRYFDAPAVIFITMDRLLDDSPMSFMDIGALVQTICIAARSYGLGTCIEEQGVMYPDIVRQITNIPAYKRLMISIAIGYPDSDFPANRLVTKRLPLENVVSWLGFDSD
jgi:nitroreductase